MSHENDTSPFTSLIFIYVPGTKIQTYMQATLASKLISRKSPLH